MINTITGMVTNIHKFVKHKWQKKIPKKWKNLGTWRYVTTFKYLYPNIPDILTKQYGLNWEDKIIAYITKEITTPKFSRYRTKFKKVFYGNLRGYAEYLRGFMRKSR